MPGAEVEAVVPLSTRPRCSSEVVEVPVRAGNVVLVIARRPEDGLEILALKPHEAGVFREPQEVRAVTTASNPHKRG
jgi:hypothetical protein